VEDLLTVVLPASTMPRMSALCGLFPFFRGYVSAEEIEEAGAFLSNVTNELWSDLLAAIPAAWGVSSEGLQAIDRFLLARARFLTDNLHRIVHSELYPARSISDNSTGGE
jgi:hypothetical protein